MLPVRSFKGRLVLWTLLLGCLAVSVLPFVWSILQSLKTEFDATARTPVFLFHPTLSNYRQIWFNSWSQHATHVTYGLGLFVVVLVMLRVMAPRLPWSPKITSIISLAAVTVVLFAVPHLLDTTQMYTFFINSVVVSALTTVASVFLAVFSGYALARYAGRAAIIVLLAAVTFRALPRLGFVLPYYWFAQRTGLFDTKLLLVATLTALSLPFSMWLLRGFFRDIPPEIEEAAMMDGANRFTAFIRVIVPSAWPGIVATGFCTPAIGLPGVPPRNSSCAEQHHACRRWRGVPGRAGCRDTGRSTGRCSSIRDGTCSSRRPNVPEALGQRAERWRGQGVAWLSALALGTGALAARLDTVNRPSARHSLSRLRPVAMGGGASVERRTMRGSNSTRRGRPPAAPSICSTTSRAAVRAISFIRWLTSSARKEVQAASGRSSHPVTETSSGTRRPRRARR